MPYQSVFVPAEVFTEHNGVTIYHVYKNDDVEQGARTYSYAITEDGSDSDPDWGGTFDVRDLPAWREPIHHPDLPFDEVRTRLDDAILHAIRIAIDDRYLTNRRCAICECRLVGLERPYHLTREHRSGDDPRPCHPQCCPECRREGTV